MNVIQWNPSKIHTIGDTAVCSEYTGVRISEASGIHVFLVGVGMCTHAVDRYEVVF